MAEWRKMLSGEIYAAQHPYFHKLLQATRTKLKQFNDMDPNDLEGLLACARSILGSCGTHFHINQPFRCDYGCNISVGDHVFVNFNLTVLDEALVTIGNHVFIGPNVSIYTACHPTDPDERRDGREWALPVSIGDDVWIGGGATILPGVSIGNGAVVAAGAVVAKSVESRTIVGGNPARIIRTVS